MSRRLARAQAREGLDNVAQVLTAKQTAFVQKYASQVQQFLTCADNLALSNAEFADDAYGTGGANQLTDAVVQTVLPASDAALFNSGEASIVTVLNAVASVRSSLEWFRP